MFPGVGPNPSPEGPGRLSRGWPYSQVLGVFSDLPLPPLFRLLRLVHLQCLFPREAVGRVFPNLVSLPQPPGALSLSRFPLEQFLAD